VPRLVQMTASQIAVDPAALRAVLEADGKR
jgi:hypothetical protein